MSFCTEGEPGRGVCAGPPRICSAALASPGWAWPFWRALPPTVIGSSVPYGPLCPAQTAACLPLVLRSPPFFSAASPRGRPVPRPARTGRNGATSTSGCGRTSNRAVSESWAGRDTWPLRATGAAKTVSPESVTLASVTLASVTSRIVPSPPHRCRTEVYRVEGYRAEGYTADPYTADRYTADGCLSDPSMDDPSTDDSSTDDPFPSGRWSDRVGCRRAPGRRCRRLESDAPGGARRCGRPAPAGSG
jgi:hypothetical protein